ncbi:hypothetical protein F4604DRAFT_1932362 [Suillus subluteus]|nr:hypothetical protein F4604DRAFT_1932362 [Suillus subluteus]
MYTSTLTATTHKETVTVSCSSGSQPRASLPSPMISPSHCPSHATAVNVVTYIPPIPHPSELLVPHPDEEPDAFWIIIIGQEVGIFYHWVDVAECTLGISGAVQVRKETWADALRLYTRKHNEGTVEARPTVGGHFWPPHVSQAAVSPPSLPSPTLSSTSSEDSIWTHVEDLPEQDASPTLPADDDPTVSFTDRIMERGDSSSWASRNPTRPVIPTRSHPACLTEAQKASHMLKTAQNKESSKALQDAIAQFIQDYGKKLHELVLAHHVSDDHVKNLIGLQTHYKKTREPQLHNALVHAKSKEVNEGLAHGQKYTMAEVQKMVAEDPNMHNLTHEEKKEFIKQLMDHRELQTSGVRASNVVAAWDVVSVMDGVSKEGGSDVWLLNKSNQPRTGIYAMVLMVHGHVNDQIQSTWIATDNASEFWEDRMEVALDDVAHQFEEWACIQKKNVYFFGHATGKMDITMNYQNYDKSIVLIYGIKLDGWPVGLPFLAPSHMHTVIEVCMLRNALKTGACQWKKLTRRELEDFREDIKKREEAGEVVGTVHKKCADAGKAPADNSANVSGEKENEPSSKKKRKSCAGKQSSRLKRVQPRSCELIEDSKVEQVVDSSQYVLLYAHGLY